MEKMTFWYELLSLLRLNLKSKIESNKKVLGIYGNLALLFVLINIYVLTFINGVFWDDWVIHDRESDFYNSFFRMAGAFDLVGSAHHFFQSTGVWLYKVTIFIVLHASVLIFWLILIELKISEPLQKILLVCIIVVPLFEARYLSIHLFYVFSIFFFLCAFWLILKEKFILAQPFFWIAFINNSYVLVGPAAILFHILIFGDQKKLKGFFITGVVATAFVLIKFILYKPYGSYEGYNKIEFNLIYPTLTKFFSQFESLFQWMTVGQINGGVLRVILFLLVGFFISYFIIYRRLGVVGNKLTKIDHKFLLWSALVAIIGLVPYFLVGKTPYLYYDFGSRNFSGSFIGLIGLIGYFSNLLGGQKYFIGRISISVFFGIMVSINLFVMEEYRIDDMKSQAIIKAIEDIDYLENKLIIIEDSTGIPWVGRRKGLSFYEWGGIFRDRFGRDLDNWNYFVYDAVYWTYEGCYKNSGLYRRELSSDISDRENNLATYIKLEPGITSTPFVKSITATAIKNVNVCHAVCGECGF